MASSTPISALFLFFLLASGSAATAPSKRRLLFYFNDILYDGKNAYRTTLAGENHLGDMVVFDDPVNLDNDLQPTQVRCAQSLCFYGKRDIITAWLGFSFVFNYTKRTGGSFNFPGANPLMGKAEDISVIGGTGDFFMGQGRAILMINSFKGKLYFRLRLDFNLYESW
ncbi:putative plant disease resistance response protein [Rosa chinensis]|uniref:Dirigent protein n=1 Tax=Rosa chinensis TaxID=74649 RepID=A0A2P6P6G6_ROSCH|nr:dirigent protein [Rosa chinensis]PRQ17533.1 putative plant disease resistance response protein [Rosa chinensis]